jgi:hypothetical protein
MAVLSKPNIVRVTSASAGAQEAKQFISSIEDGIGTLSAISKGAEAVLALRASR